MSRRDIHLDAMLRHLGAAYYDSLHGRAAPGDVTRAVDQVASQLGEQSLARATAPQPRTGGVRMKPGMPVSIGSTHQAAISG